VRTLIGWALVAVGVVAAAFVAVQGRSVEIEDPVRVDAVVADTWTGGSKRCFAEVAYDVDGRSYSAEVETTRATCRNPPATMPVVVERTSPALAQSEAMDDARSVVPWVALAVALAVVAVASSLLSRRRSPRR
jgi:hypothetical protein